jgi:hypothetical protein
MRKLAMTALVVVSAACMLAAEPAKTPEGAKARAEFKEELAKAQADFDDAVKKAGDGHRARLKELLDAETKAGNLDEAPAVREEIRGLEAGRKGAWVAGTWRIKYHPNRTTRTYVIRATGEVEYGDRKAVLKAQADAILLDFGDDKVERLTFAGDRLFVEHFAPRRNFGSGAPDQVGVGELVKK